MRKLFLLWMLLTGLSASAYDYPYLAFQTSDGKVQTVSVESLTLTIADGVLKATNGAGSKTFTISDLSKMYFSTDQSGTTGIKQVATSEKTVKVYSLSGMQLGSYQSVAEAHTALKSGLYVIVEDGKSYKMNLK